MSFHSRRNLLDNLLVVRRDAVSTLDQQTSVALDKLGDRHVYRIPVLSDADYLAHSQILELIKNEISVEVLGRLDHVRFDTPDIPVKEHGFNMAGTFFCQKDSLPERISLSHRGRAFL
jgi:hypothetical protein